MRVAIIGGGAAGFFAAIAVKENYPNAEVVLIEKSSKLLAKVKVSGGGRCNVTNGCPTISELIKAYPRGGKHLKKAFSQFDNNDTRKWFANRGVNLVEEDDGRVFPSTNTSQTIIDCLIDETARLGIIIEYNIGIESIESIENGFLLQTSKSYDEPLAFEKLIIATGGSPKLSGFNWLAGLGHKIESPVPSLFTFNMPGNPITKLMGVVSTNAQTAIQGTKLKAQGPLLITHWGMSGPAILKLSAFGARILSDKKYKFNVQVNWVGQPNNEFVHGNLKDIAQANAKKQLRNYRPYGLPEKLWLFILDKAELNPDAPWNELGKKGMNKLVNLLTNDIYEVSGKTTFKEEFVTCGGVSLDSIDMNTMQSKVCSNLYFAGEVIDVDGITGGYNFQAAWTTGFIAGKLG
jgi:predicted Rossmann fold flavoprotein